MVFETIRAGLPEDLYAVDLMDAYRSLGEIICEEVEDDLVNTIFSKFCMGK
jgi:tRNA modification GTPase